MVEPHRQGLAAAASEIDVEGLGAHVAGGRRDGGHHGGDVRRHHVGEAQAAGADLREIVAEPGGEGRVHVDDGALGIDREEARRRMVEIVDRVLELLEHVLLALALVRHVGDRPQRRGAAVGASERPHADAIPAEIAPARRRRRDPHLLARRAPVARRLGETVDRLRDLRGADEQALDGLQIREAVAAGKHEVALVGVEDAAVVLDHDEPVGGGIGHRLGEVVAGALAAELDGTDRHREQEEHPRHAEERKQQQDQRLGALGGDEAEAQRRADEERGQEQEQPDPARALRAVDRRAGWCLARFSHGIAAVRPRSRL